MGMATDHRKATKPGSSWLADMFSSSWSSMSLLRHPQLRSYHCWRKHQSGAAAETVLASAPEYRAVTPSAVIGRALCQHGDGANRKLRDRADSMPRLGFLTIPMHYYFEIFSRTFLPTLGSLVIITVLASRIRDSHTYPPHARKYQPMSLARRSRSV